MRDQNDQGSDSAGKTLEQAMKEGASTKQPPSSPSPAGDPWPLHMTCDYLRAELKTLENMARRLKDAPDLKGEQAYAGQHGEMIAQSMLAVRHIEDARMRIGKVLQYSGDGVSIYDKAELAPT